MLHSNGRAPQRGKHSIVTLLSSKLNRAVADISAGVPTHRQLAVRPQPPETDGAPPLACYDSRTKRIPPLKLGSSLGSSILEHFGLSLTPNKSETRGGTRIPCEIRATLVSLDPLHPCSEPCQIVLVNLRGCAARFCRSVEIGLAVGLRGLPAMTTATARVVNCISLGEHEKLWLLGLTLDKPGNVWGIDTPPEDWTE